jgi:hypothetical protein
MNLNALSGIQLLALEALVDVGAAFVALMACVVIATAATFIRTKLVTWHPPREACGR